MNRPRFVETSSAKTLAVFIDADNLNDPTALDRILIDLRSVADRVLIRKAYGRPESLKGIEAVLWKHGVRPVANLIVDKVTTDSALLLTQWSQCAQAILIPWQFVLAMQILYHLHYG